MAGLEQIQLKQQQQQLKVDHTNSGREKVK